MCKAPRGETAYVRYHDMAGNERFLLTADKSREKYILYKCENGTLIRLGKGSDPLGLEEKFNVMREIGVMV